MRQAKPLTVPYSAVQGTFWMSYCISISFAAVYLQGLGYTNAGLGLILAAGNLLGALLGPELSARIDTSERLTAWMLVWPELILQAAMLLVLAVYPAKGTVTGICFILFVAFNISLNSLNLKLFVDCTHGGQAVNYGVARGMGSMLYVLISVALGVMVQRYSIRVLPWAGLAMCILQALAHLWLRHSYNPLQTRSTETKQPGRSMSAFLRENPRFTLLLAGTAMLYFGHNTSTNFFINLTRRAGGDAGTMGVLNGFMAAVEIPVMVFIGRIRGHRRSADLLRISFVFFVLKAVALTLADSIPLLFCALVLQAPSFALYTALIVDYVAETVPFEDSAKAQSLAFSMTTMGAVLASLISGRLYDQFSVTATLWVACGITAAGMLLALAGVREPCTDTVPR